MAHLPNAPSAELPAETSIAYPLATRVLHWAMAIIILGLIGLGWYMTPWSEHVEQLYFWHKSFGMLALFLLAARIVARRRAAIPPLPATLQPWERKAAAVSHKLLYALMLAVPLAGYTDSSAYQYSSGIHFFVVDLPELIPDNDAVHKAGNILHKIFAYSLLALVAIHALGALKHRFLDADRRSDVFPRILIRWSDLIGRRRTTHKLPE